MYPSTLKAEFRSARTTRRLNLLLSHLFVAAVAFLSALSLVAHVMAAAGK